MKESFDIFLRELWDNMYALELSFSVSQKLFKRLLQDLAPVDITDTSFIYDSDYGRVTINLDKALK